MILFKINNAEGLCDYSYQPVKPENSVEWGDQQNCQVDVQDLTFRTLVI